ncbi:MAG: hypothetical protein ACLQVD_20900 [Capsulimonadaceae bacterium]
MNYCYTVTAVDAAGTSGPSPEATIPVAASVTDPYNNWNVATSHTANWEFDTSCAQQSCKQYFYVNGGVDPSRAERTVDDPESITYLIDSITGQTDTITSFSAVVFTFITPYSGNPDPIPDVEFAASTDNGQTFPTSVKLNEGIRTYTQGPGFWAYHIVTPSGTLPGGTNGLRVLVTPDSTGIADVHGDNDHLRQSRQRRHDDVGGGIVDLYR